MKIKFILAFAWFYGYSGIKRSPIYILAYLSLPLSLLFFIYVISRGQLIDYGILGGLISVIVSNSISIIGDFTFMRLQLRLQDLIVATDAGAIDYIMGLTIGNFIFSLPGLLLYIILGLILHVFNGLQLLIILVILAVLLFSTTSLAITLASLIRHTRNSWGISTFVSLLLTILPPLYYPSSVLPSWALDVLYISPATSAAVFIQGLLRLQDFPVYSLAIFIVESLILLLLPLRVMRWREN